MEFIRELKKEKISGSTNIDFPDGDFYKCIVVNEDRSIFRQSTFIVPVGRDITEKELNILTEEHFLLCEKSLKDQGLYA